MVTRNSTGPREGDGQRRQKVVLLDRQTERAAIDQVLDAVRNGFSGSLMLRGGPGVGKTTLLQYAVAAAPDLRVSSVAGVESEISMEYGGLHQLLIPFLPLLDELPAAAAGRAAGRFRPGSGAAAGAVPGRTGDADAAFPGGRRPAAAVRHRRRALDRSRIGAGARLRRPPSLRRPRRVHRRQ